MLWVTKVREKRQDQKCRGSWRSVCTYLRMRRSYVRAPVAWVGCWFICVRLCQRCDDVLIQQAWTKYDEQKQVHDSWLRNHDEEKERGNEDASSLWETTEITGKEIKSCFISSSKALSFWPLTWFFVSFLYKLFNLKHLRVQFLWANWTLHHNSVWVWSINGFNADLPEF